MRSSWIAILVVALSLPDAMAAKAPSRVPELQPLGQDFVSNAVAAFVTTRGQKFIRDNFQEMLFRNGYSLSDGGFDGWDYQAESPLSIQNLPVNLRKFSGTLGELRDTVKHWLRGFDLRDPLISANATGISYHADITSFRLSIDPDMSRVLAGDQGLAAVFELQASSFEVDVDQVRAKDANNAFLGEFGMNHVRVSTLAGSPPLIVRVPVIFGVSENGTIQYRVLSLVSNVRDLKLDLTFDRPILLPQVQVTINGNVMKLNQKKLEDAVLAKKDRLLEALQAYLGEMAELKVPGVVNQVISDSLPNGFKDLNQMDPPGEDNPKPEDRFSWGLIPQEMRLTPNFASIGLSGFVSDPRLKIQPPYLSRPGEENLPFLNLVDFDTYDIGLALNQDLINRVLDLSFRRHYFNHIELKGGSSLTLVEAPRFLIDRTNAIDHARLHIKAAQQVTGLSTLVVASHVEFEVDIDVHLIHTGSRDISLAMSRIDEGSVYVEPRFIKIGLFKKLIYRAIRSKVHAANLELGKAEKVLVAKLPVPEKLAGMPIRVSNFQADANGYLVLYLTYDSGEGKK